MAKSEGPKRSEITALSRSRMLVGVFPAQDRVASMMWFFVSWFPSDLVKSRGISVLDASLIAAIPAVARFVGGVATSFFSDWLLGRTGSLGIARKTPIEEVKERVSMALDKGIGDVPLPIDAN